MQIPAMPSHGGPGAMKYDPQNVGADFEPENSIEADQEEQSEPDGQWQYWHKEIKAGLAYEKTSRRESRQAEKEVYGVPGQEFTDPSANKDDVHIIYSNQQTLRPMVYTQPPQPIIKRRFGGDGNGDPMDTMATEVLQRLAQYQIDRGNFDVAMESARDQYLAVGRGVSRVMYRCQIDKVAEMVADQMTGMMVMQEVEKKVREEVVFTEWSWSRVIVAPSTSWETRAWTAWETPMTRSEVEKKFGADKAAATTYPFEGLHGSIHADELDALTDAMDETDADHSDETVMGSHKQCLVYEIWERETRRVKYFCPTYQDGLLFDSEDPLGLDQFYDCPRFLYSSRKPGTLKWRPDIAFYWNRAKEIDMAARKMKVILKAISVSGFYPGAMEEEINKLLNGENKIIPIENWHAFIAEKGGKVENILQWLPLEHFAKAATALQGMIEVSKQILYEISGVSDLVRGQGDPNETATAQSIKGQYAGLRMKDRQRIFGEFCRDNLRIGAEIAVEHSFTNKISASTHLSDFVRPRHISSTYTLRNRSTPKTVCTV